MTTAIKEQVKQELPKKEEKVEKNETQEVIEEVKAFENIKGSNQFDENKTKVIVDGAIKIAEIRKQKELEIESMKQRLQQEMIQVGEKLRERQMKYENNQKVLDKVLDFGTAVAAFGTLLVFGLAVNDKNKTIELEKIKQGLMN